MIPPGLRPGKTYSADVKGGAGQVPSCFVSAILTPYHMDYLGNDIPVAPNGTNRNRHDFAKIHQRFINPSVKYVMALLCPNGLSEFFKG